MINGIINVYKEKGYTSFDVVAKLRGILGQKKIGHTGTLDPDAEGVLPVCLGRATKVCDLLTDKDKVYEAVLLLGKETDTQDISGKILNQSEVSVSIEDVKKVISSFVGEQLQIPPMYSALKVNGQKLCDLARKGIEVERKARPITVYEIEILNVDLPRVRMLVHCSKGTYIRTLCNDIGRKLGCFGCMESLLRTRVSCFTINHALKLDEIEKLVKESAKEVERGNYTRQLFQEFVVSVDSVFSDFPSGIICAEAEKFMVNGNKIPFSMVELSTQDYSEPRFRLYDWKHNFIGIYQPLEDEKSFKPVKLFMDET